MRRLKLERRRKKKLMATFAGSSDRQDAYLARRQELLKGWELDKVPTTEGDQIAQVRQTRCARTHTCTHKQACASAQFQ